MSIGQGLRMLPGRPYLTTRGGIRSAGWFWAASGLSLLGYTVLFVVLHLHSLGWAPSQVLQQIDAYWQFFYGAIFSENRVTASPRSALAAQHPLLLLLAFAILALGYLLSLVVIRALPATHRPGLRTLVALAAAFGVPLLLLPNLLSGDVYSYISFGRVATLHGGNPFIDPPNRFPFDPYLRWVDWGHVPSVYGPTWLYLSVLLTVLVESTWSHVVTYVLVYKLLALLLHLLNGALIWSILWHWRSEQRSWGTALYLLNPLALIEFAGSAHNDVLMITLILAGILLHLRGWWLWAVAAFTLAVLTKWIALPLLPLYGLLLVGSGSSRMRRLKYAAGVGGVAVALSAGLYLPYWEGPATLKILLDAPPQKRLINSVGAMLVDEIQYGLYWLGHAPHPLTDDFLLIKPRVEAVDPVEQMEGPTWETRQRTRLRRYELALQREQSELVRSKRALEGAVRTVSLLAVLVACVLGALATRGLRTMLLAAAWIFFTYTTIGAVWVWPWYATWFVALAALLDWRVTGRAAVLLSTLVLLIYPLFPELPVPAPMGRFRALIIFGPPLVFAGYHAARLARSYLRGEWSLDDLSRLH